MELLFIFYLIIIVYIVYMVKVYTIVCLFIWYFLTVHCLNLLSVDCNIALHLLTDPNVGEHDLFYY